MIVRSAHQVEMPGGGGLLKQGLNTLTGLQPWQRQFLDELVRANLCEIVEEDDATQAAPSPSDVAPPVTTTWDDKGGSDRHFRQDDPTAAPSYYAAPAAPIASDHVALTPAAAPTAITESGEVLRAQSASELRSPAQPKPPRQRRVRRQARMA